MSEQQEPNFREQMEVRIIALLLGEAGAFETAEIEQAIQRDPALAAFHAQMRRTIGLAREASKQFHAPSQPPAEQPKLSAERRQALLAKFKEARAVEVVVPLPKRPRRRWLVPASLAAGIIFLLSSLAIPHLKGFKRGERLSINLTDSKFASPSSANALREAPIQLYNQLAAGKSKDPGQAVSVTVNVQDVKPSEIAAATPVPSLPPASLVSSVNIPPSKPQLLAQAETAPALVVASPGEPAKALPPPSPKVFLPPSAREPALAAVDKDLKESLIEQGVTVAAIESPRPAGGPQLGADSYGEWKMENKNAWFDSLSESARARGEAASGSTPTPSQTFGNGVLIGQRADTEAGAPALQPAERDSRFGRVPARSLPDGGTRGRTASEPGANPVPARGDLFSSAGVVLPSGGENGQLLGRLKSDGTPERSPFVAKNGQIAAGDLQINSGLASAPMRGVDANGLELFDAPKFPHYFGATLEDLESVEKKGSGTKDGVNLGRPGTPVAETAAGDSSYVGVSMAGGGFGFDRGGGGRTRGSAGNGQISSPASLTKGIDSAARDLQINSGLASAPVRGVDANGTDLSLVAKSEAGNRDASGTAGPLRSGAQGLIYLEGGNINLKRTGERNSDVVDSEGHGTHVAGTVAGQNAAEQGRAGAKSSGGGFGGGGFGGGGGIGGAGGGAGGAGGNGQINGRSSLANEGESAARTTHSLALTRNAWDSFDGTTNSVALDAGYYAWGAKPTPAKDTDADWLSVAKANQSFDSPTITTTPGRIATNSVVANYFAGNAVLAGGFGIQTNTPGSVTFSFSTPSDQNSPKAAMLGDMPLQGRLFRNGALASVNGGEVRVQNGEADQQQSTLFDSPAPVVAGGTTPSGEGFGSPAASRSAFQERLGSVVNRSGKDGEATTVGGRPAGTGLSVTAGRQSAREPGLVLTAPPPAPPSTGLPAAPAVELQNQTVNKGTVTLDGVVNASGAKPAANQPQLAKPYIAGARPYITGTYQYESERTPSVPAPAPTPLLSPASTFSITRKLEIGDKVTLNGVGNVPASKADSEHLLAFDDDTSALHGVADKAGIVDGSSPKAGVPELEKASKGLGANRFYRLDVKDAEAKKQAPLVGPLVINEIAAHPDPTQTADAGIRFLTRETAEVPHLQKGFQQSIDEPVRREAAISESRKKLAEAQATEKSGDHREAAKLDQLTDEILAKLPAADNGAVVKAKQELLEWGRQDNALLSKRKPDGVAASGLTGGVYSVNIVGYVNEFADFNASVAKNTSIPASTLPQPNAYARTNLVHAGKSRETTLSKLDQIRLDRFEADGLPLGEVVKNLNDEARKSDPEKHGVNLLVSANPDPNSASPAIDPATGLPVNLAANQSDLGATTVTIPLRKNITLRQALEAVEKSTARPIKYSVEGNAVVLSSDTAEKKAKEEAPAPKPAPSIPATPQPEISARENAFSTFSLNVSDVSFKLAAASLENSVMPDPASIRVEEFVNAFNYHDPAPQAGACLAFAWERAHYPFAHNRDMLRFAIQTAARGREPQKPLNLVILLDNSGSMERADRVQIVHEAMKVLAQQLQPQDRISVVAFARTARLWVNGMSGGHPKEFLDKVRELNPDGGTNLEDALGLGYATAARHFVAQGINRVILLTDGAANLGNVEPEALKQKVVSNRIKGIALDCFGIGWEGYNDDLLEVLSHNGDGRYGFLNEPEQAAPEFANQLAGALNVEAADVKAQVEFNPSRVLNWRQIGYAKHQLTKQQFRDNTVDAAELAASESGNALYAIEVNPQGNGPLGVVRVRYKVPATGRYVEQSWTIPYQPKVPALDQASPAMRLAVTAAAFGEWLSRSPYAGEVTPAALQPYLNSVCETYSPDSRPQRLAGMIRQAQLIGGK